MAIEPFRATLVGLQSLNVQVEPVNADAERDGLCREDLQEDVESALREAGFTVLDQARLFADTVGTPFLHLDVMTVRLDGRYAYSIRLELWQAVRLERAERIRALAMTWNTPQIVGTVASEALGEVRRAVRAAVGEFVRDCGGASLGPDASFT
jgi:hypothetical protein